MALSVAFAAPAASRPVTQISKLEELAQHLRTRSASLRGELFVKLSEAETGPQAALNADRDIELMFVDETGIPRFYETDNLIAAETVSADEVWPGGSAGLSLDGSGTVLGELGLWDAGGVLLSHQEFTGRATQIDSLGGTHYHSTHVAGTMIAEGIDSDAQGMSYAATIAAYDWNDADSEMALAGAAGMNVSNHSYGFVTGWRWGWASSDWYWFGDTDISEVEDYGFGYYGESAQAWDQIAHDAPYYTICKSAGNDRDDDGPDPGDGHYVWDNDIEDWIWSTTTRRADGWDNGYDTVSWLTTAKNIITVGAVEDIPGGYSSPGDVVTASFSGYGPTDDGRIKPDLVANGTGLYSCTDSGNSSYASYSGTSMSAPNLAGALNLLVRHYEDTHSDETPLASTMKAVLVQTADEAGSYNGPDFKHGWGLLNTQTAAELISEDGAGTEFVIEGSLSDGDSDICYIEADGLTAIRVTLAWTDPPGTPAVPALDPTDAMLVNDLDVRLQTYPTLDTYEPYLLDPANPDNAPGTGDNARDVTEQIFLDSYTGGEFRVVVSHKGTLTDAQGYSLVSTHELNSEPSGIDSDLLLGDSRILGISPNPFNPRTMVAFQLGQPSPVDIVVYDAAGRVVRMILRASELTPGDHEVAWDGTDAAGKSVASGVYFCRLQAGEQTDVRRMVLLK
jgi:hypothetical protein